MTLADCRWHLFACRMIYRSSPAVVILGRPPPTFLTAVPVVWNAFQAHEMTLLLIPNSAATLVTEKETPYLFQRGLIKRGYLRFQREDCPRQLNSPSCKRLTSWFLLFKATELGRKIFPVRPPHVLKRGRKKKSVAF
ncbi:hypothetical protein TNCV_1859591 [Trichonephila clavipes]|nr:hypothetical protein TNCV_1859591 [Trichonephila clavipes]